MGKRLSKIPKNVTSYLGQRCLLGPQRCHTHPGEPQQVGPEEKIFLEGLENCHCLSQNLVSGNIIRIIVIVIVLTAVRGERGSSGGADAIPRQRFGLRREQVHRKTKKKSNTLA